MVKDEYFIRSADFLNTSENFLIAAVVAILGIRLFLKLTNYHQIGSGGLHIAHMLFGGGLMLIALILLFTFLTNAMRKTAAIIGGLGFGLFIDELGKFITRDNNYFYQPTFSIIYIIFILLYLLFYAFGKYWHYSSKEYLVNSLEYLKEAVIKDLDVEEKTVALGYLSRADKRSVITRTMAELYRKLDAIPNPKPTVPFRLKTFMKERYLNLVKKKWFGRMFNSFFIIQFLVSIFAVIISGLTLIAIFIPHAADLKIIQENRTGLIELFASTFSGIFIILGVLKMRRSRLEAYHLFKRSLFVSIFLIQVFSFYKEQLSAFFGLLFNILILFTLNYFIEQEKAISVKVS